MELRDLLSELRGYDGLLAKREIGRFVVPLKGGGRAGVIGPGDDAGAVPLGDGYLLLSGETMRESLLSDPSFAGFAAVTVNVNDIYAMGGRPLGVVLMIGAETFSDADRGMFLEGFGRGLEHYGVPLLGGHTGGSEGPRGVAVSIAGFAKDLLRGDGAGLGDELLFALDLSGRRHPRFFAWDTVTGATGEETLRKLSALQTLANRRLCTSVRDISNAGLLGTLAMVLEASGGGALVRLDALPLPPGIDMSWWLKAYPSYGFVVTAAKGDSAEVSRAFSDAGVACERLGEITGGSQMVVRWQSAEEIFIDWKDEPVTGIFGSG